MKKYFAQSSASNRIALFVSAIVVVSAVFIGISSMSARADGHGGHHKSDQARKHMMRMDINKNGSVSRDEFNAAHSKMFDKIDQNKDDALSKDELRAHRKKMKDGIKQGHDDYED